MWTRQRSPDAGAVPARPLVLDEASARAVVLVQAVETTDLQGRIVGTPERDQAEQEAVEAVRDPAHPHTPDPARYLAARAQRLLDIVALRQPAIAQLREPPPWRAWFTYALPAAGFLAGALVDRIGNPRALDLVSPTLLAFIGWNLVVYLLLAVSAFLPRRDRATKWPWGIRASAHASAAQAFHTLWWRVAGPLESRRLQQVLHLAAAAWALGICVSIAAGGLFREYRVGWESTWLGAPQVHAVVSALTAVPQLLLPVEGFTLADIERLRNSPSVGPQEGRRWVLLYVTLLIVLVVVPRLLLALYAASRARG